jgi:RNA polymerase sigma-70 factor
MKSKNHPCHVRFRVFAGKRGMQNSVSTNEVDPWSAAAIEQNREWLIAYLLGMIGDPHAVDDLVQEVFHTAFVKREHFEAGRSFGAWLRGIARNLALRHLERKGRDALLMTPETLEVFDQAATAAEAADLWPDARERRLAFLRECLEGLGRRARQLIELRYAREESAASVAGKLDLSVSAVNVGVFRARASLAECITRKEAGA